MSYDPTGIIARDATAELACPSCSAKPGAACAVASGDRFEHGTHVTRLAAYREWVRELDGYRKQVPTGRSVHQNQKTLEEAVEGFIGDAEALLHAFYEAEKKKDGRAGWHSIREVQRPLEKLQAALDAFRGTERPVPRKPYQKTVKKVAGRDGNEITEMHESYGVVQINRGQGSSRKLFASSMKHTAYFTLTIRRAKRVSGEWGEHFYDDGRVPIVEIALSASQFVEMITSMNMGSGIPCTLNSVEGVNMDDVPEDAGTELEVMHENFKERLSEVVGELVASEKVIDETLAKKSLVAADKDLIRKTVHKAVRLLGDSAPFVLKVFGEHTEKMVVKGKTEIESFINVALQRAGIKAIRDSGGVLLLGDGPTTKKET